VSVASVTGSTNVTGSPGAGRVSGGAPSAGAASPSIGAGFTSTVPTAYVFVVSSRFGGVTLPGATVTAKIST
jgi:hypothetical protein